MTDLRDAAESATAGAPVAPERIWATVNGASTRLPDGVRQFIGGWSEDPTRPRAVEYVKASALTAAQERIAVLEGLVGQAEAIFTHCTVSDGVCCCGDNMENHADPMWCGHSPVDHGGYVADGWLAEARATLSPAVKETK